MNPVRYLQGEWTPWALGLFAIAVMLLLITWWARRREKRGDWGPGLVGVPAAEGYSPADLRGAVTSGGAVPSAEAWLLGLAAPYVEQAGLLHGRWSLVPAFCGDDWRRRLLAIARGWGTVRARDWRTAVALIERRLETDPDPGSTQPVDRRPRMIAQLAMLLRLGVAARHISGTRARQRLATAAEPLRRDYGDWLSFGTAFIDAEELAQPGRTPDLRADLRLLYADGGPWQHVHWAGPDAVRRRP